MESVRFRSDVTVELVKASASDNDVLWAARVSTKGEQSLVAKGRGDRVLALRQEYQAAMRDESSAMVAELTGCNVIAMMSANHIDPDLGAEIYVLDGAPRAQGKPTSLR